MDGEFSAILPTRGDSCHLREALDSALADSLTGEVLLVHDRRAGEPPLDEPLRVDARVRRLEASAHGVSAARNCGMDAARRPYLAFLDDDDVWAPDHLERARRMTHQYPRAALLGCDAWLFDDRTDDGSTRAPRSGEGLRRHGPELPEGAVALGRLLLANPFTTPSVVLVRERLRPEDRFDPALHHMEDYDLWLRLARDRELVFDPHPSVLVRKRPGTASQNWRGMAECSLEVLRRVLDRGLPADEVPRSKLRRRLGRLWHELAYACLIDDDLPVARRALRQSISRTPLLLKNYAYLLASGLPAPARHALLARGRRLR